MDEKYYPIVVQALAGPDFTVFAYFSDGAIVHYDIKPLIKKGGVFAQLGERDFFRNRLTVLNNTVAWDVSGDFDPCKCIDIDPFVVYEGERVKDPLDEDVYPEFCAEGP